MAERGTGGEDREAGEGVTPTPDPRNCDPADSPNCAPGATLSGRPAGFTALRSLSALEGDHAAHRTMGPHAGPHLPRLEARRVVPRDARDPRRGRARSEPPPGHGAAHLPADPAVSPAALVRGAARRQRAAAAPLVGIDLRRLPAMQRAGGPRPARPQGLVPALQRTVPRRLGGLRV